MDVYTKKKSSKVHLRGITVSAWVIIVLLAILFPIQSRGKTVRPDSSSSSRNVRWIEPYNGNQHLNEISLWYGYAFDSFRMWGKTRDATLQQVGIRYNRKLLYLYNQLLEYTFEFDLYSRYNYPAYTEHPREDTLTGIGVSPLGFQINFMPHRIFQPFFKSSGGIMILNGPFPDERGKKFNFTFGIGGGVEAAISPSSSLSLGYKFYHLSNGQTGQVNPGIDSGFMYGAFTLMF